MEEQQQRTQVKDGEGKKSTYSHFIREAERLISLKEGFERALLEGDEDRSRTLDRAKILMAELGVEPNGVLTGAEFMQLDGKIRTMEYLSREMHMLETDTTLEARTKEPKLADDARLFNSKAHEFIGLWNGALYAHGLSLQFKKEKDPVEKLYASLEVSQQMAFRNRFGVLISPQMEIFCRALYVRGINMWDNPIPVEGVPGRGKTTFAYAAATTLSGMYSMPYDPYYNIFVREDRETCRQVISKAAPHTVFEFLEAGNQFRAKTWWNEEQLDLTAVVDINRQHGYTFFLEWKDFRLLDKEVRDANRAAAVVSIEERSKAVVRAFNKNPYNRGMTSPQKQKKEVVTFPEAAYNMLMFDALRLLSIPFYPLPEEHEKILVERKRQAGSASKLKPGKVKLTADDMYAQFLVSLPPGATLITASALKQFGLEHNFYLSIKKLATLLGQATGRFWKSMLIQEPITDEDKWRVPIDEYTARFIGRLSAQVKGVAEQAHDDKKTGE